MIIKTCSILLGVAITLVNGLALKAQQQAQPNIIVADDQTYPVPISSLILC